MDREALGRLVRETWVAWANEQPDPKPSWLVPWEELDDSQREVDMRIGEAVAAAERAKFQPAIDRVAHLAAAAQAKAIAHAVEAERERIMLHLRGFTRVWNAEHGSWSGAADCEPGDIRRAGWRDRAETYARCAETLGEWIREEAPRA